MLTQSGRAGGVQGVRTHENPSLRASRLGDELSPSKCPVIEGLIVASDQDDDARNFAGGHRLGGGFVHAAEIQGGRLGRDDEDQGKQ